MRQFIVFLFLLFATSLVAAPINLSFFSKVALEGYDAVAYFKEGKAVKGSPEHEVSYMGGKWRFKSAKHKQLFQQNPSAYAPQYGGYCAWAMSQGKQADINPNNWMIVNEKLYLNYNDKVQKRWEKNIPGFIELANQEWTKLDDRSSK